MKKIQKFLINFGPLIIWGCFIFILSSRQSIDVSDMKLIDFLVFKTLHFIEYFIFYILAFHASIKSKMSKPYLFAFYLGVIFALSDEMHQMYVPTREGTFRDVLIDSIGLAIGYIFIRVNILKKYL